MNVTSVANNPWYTESAYQPGKDGSEPLRKQFLTLAKNLHDGDLKAAKVTMQELIAAGPNKGAGSPLLQALGKAIDSGDVKSARGAFETLLGKAAEVVQKNRAAGQDPSASAPGAASGKAIPRSDKRDSGKSLDLYA